MPYSELQPGRLRLEDENTGNARWIIQKDDDLQYADGAGNLIQLLSNIKTGTKADRPSAALKGRIYFATDTGEWFYDDGSNWHRIACGGDFIGDADLDTKFETERSADEDIIRAKAGGQDIFEGYSSGIFSLVKQSAIFVQRANTQTIPNATTTKIEFDTIALDNQNEWDSTNHRWTASKDGIYIVTSSIITQGVSWNQGDFVHLDLHKNGSLYLRLDYYVIEAAVTKHLKLRGSCGVKVLAGDYLEIFVYIDRGADTDILNMASHNYLSISKVS